MKMRRIFYILPFISLILPTIAMAEVSVNIQNKNSSTTNSQSSSGVKTDVVIETNGEKKEFHTEGDEDIDWTSDDGKSSVKINNQTGSNTSVKQTSNSTINTSVNATVNGKGSVKGESKTESGKSTNNSIDKKLEKEKENIIYFLKKELGSWNKFISDFFKNLFR